MFLSSFSGAQRPPWFLPCAMSYWPSRQMIIIEFTCLLFLSLLPSCVLLSVWWNLSCLGREFFFLPCRVFVSSHPPRFYRTNLMLPSFYSFTLVPFSFDPRSTFLDSFPRCVASVHFCLYPSRLSSPFSFHRNDYVTPVRLSVFRDRCKLALYVLHSRSSQSLFPMSLRPP